MAKKNIRMDETKIIAKIKLLSNAPQYCHFPRSEPFRTSLWELNAIGSTVCTIAPHTVIESGIEADATVTIAGNPVLSLELLPGTELLFGVFPQAIGSVLVIEKIPLN
jgi:hypothetical protein